MSPSSALRSAFVIAVVAGLVVAVVSLVLIADGIAERGRDAQEAARIEALEERIPTEVEAAAEMERETEMQTERSLRRDRRNHGLGWVLLVSAVVFLGSAKSYQAMRAPTRSSLVTLGAWTGERAAPVTTRPAPAASSLATTKAVADEAIDLDLVDRLLASHGRDREATIPILQALQSHFRYLPQAALERVCEKTEIAPSQIIGVASFYSQFRRQPVGRRLVRLCHGTACHVAGIGPITDELRRRLLLAPDADTDVQRRFTLESVNCLGCCSLAPVMMIENEVAGRLTPTRAWEQLAASEVET